MPLMPNYDEYKRQVAKHNLEAYKLQARALRDNNRALARALEALMTFESDGTREKAGEALARHRELEEQA